MQKPLIQSLKLVNKVAWIFILPILLSFSSDNYTLIKSIAFTDVQMTTDNLGNAYVIAGNQLIEFDSNGKPKATYGEKNLGTLRAVDASNPFKVMLFYPDFAQISILNSKLGLESTINLRNIGITQPSLICNSNNEGYWIFDLQDFQLKKIDLNLQVRFESGNLSQALGYSILPNFMVEADRSVYLNDPESGIIVFDQFGTYFKTIPIKQLKSFQVLGDELLYTENLRLKSFHLKKLDSKEMILPPPHDTLVNARIEQNKLYLLTTAALKLYSF